MCGTLSLIIAGIVLFPGLLVAADICLQFEDIGLGFIQNSDVCTMLNGTANVETPAVSELTISYRKCYSYYCSSSQLGALLNTVITINFCPFLDDI